MKLAVIGGVLSVAVCSVGFAAPAAAEPGYGSDCVLPSVSECRLVPDGEGPHMVQVWCPDTGNYVSVFAPCPGRYSGPYS